jgi:ParB family chromosome partitioning protein
MGKAEGGVMSRAQDDASLADLKARIADLKAQLDATASEPADEAQTVAAAPSPNAPSQPQPKEDCTMIRVKEEAPTVRTRAATKVVVVPFGEIDCPANARPTNAEKVGELVRSIRAIGLQSCPTVIRRNDRYRLVAGRHRLEALRVLRPDEVAVRLVDLDDLEARLWTISENLHRQELTALQRADQVAEWIKLSEEKAGQAASGQALGSPTAAIMAPDAKSPPAANVAAPGASQPPGVSAQVRQKPQGGRPESGDSLAARDLGITRQEVQRARAIATMPDEVTARAADLGLDDNQSALLEAAKAPTPQAQVEALERRALERRAASRAEAPVRSLRSLDYLSAGEFCRWIKTTSPNDRPRVIRMLRDTANILEDEMRAEQPAP